MFAAISNELGSQHPCQAAVQLKGSIASSCLHGHSNMYVVWTDIHISKNFKSLNPVEIGVITLFSLLNLPVRKLSPRNFKQLALSHRAG